MAKFNLDFGLLIAYLVPGFIGLYVVSPYSAVLHSLLGGASKVPNAASVVPLIVLAIAAGIIINALAWAFVRPLIELSGVKRPDLRYGKLPNTVIDIYREAIESSYRYYQSYVNLFVVLFAFSLQRIQLKAISYNSFDFAIVVILAVLFFASRDSLKRSYQSMSDILTNQGESEMTNGNPKNPKPIPPGPKPKSGSVAHHILQNDEKKTDSSKSEEQVKVEEKEKQRTQGSGLSMPYHSFTFTILLIVE